ncbi:MAG: hypothetical protein ACK56I_36650, partial [bacterium]
MLQEVQQLLRALAHTSACSRQHHLRRRLRPPAPPVLALHALRSSITCPGYSGPRLADTFSKVSAL